MRVLDFSPYVQKDGSIKFTDRIRATTEYGFSWYRELQSQQDVVERLQKTLDNKYTLIRNARLPDLDLPIPLILIGPSGVYVIYTNPIRGVFRAKGEAWTVLDSRRQSFKPKNPNLITRTMLMARAVEAYLKASGFSTEHIEGVLILPNPGTHVDAVRPAVRVILADAIERFAARVVQSPRVLTPEEMRIIVDRLTSVKQQGEEDFRKEKEFQESALRGRPMSGLERRLFHLQRRLNFTKGQWVLLFLLVGLEFVILAGFVIFIYLTTTGVIQF